MVLSCLCECVKVYAPGFTSFGLHVLRLNDSQPLAWHMSPCLCSACCVHSCANTLRDAFLLASRRWAGMFKRSSTQHRLKAWPVEQNALQAFRQIVHAPLWMKRDLPKGTPARLALWEGKDSPPLKQAVDAFFKQDAVEGQPANFTRALEFFVPRYQAWKADPSNAITDADVLELLPTLFRGEMGAGEGAETQAPRVQPATCEAGICPATSASGLLA